MFARILQLIRSGLGRLWRSFKALINGIWNLITFPIWLFNELNNKLNKLLQLFANEDTREFALDIVNTLISAAGLLAVVIAGLQFLYTYNKDIEAQKLAQETQKFARQILIADRITKAIEQIGKKDQEEVVIEGIYSLERIAKDSPEDQWRILEVLTRFVRKNSPLPADILEQLEPVNNQVQAALTVIGRRNPDQDNTQIDLSDINLSSANLSGANLSGANFETANLSGANFSSANFETAKLSSANLRNANLSGANFSSAKLNNANLNGAKLNDAILSDANLNGANLNGAKLNDAILSDANLNGAELQRADLEDAILEAAELQRAVLYLANLNGSFLMDANLDSAILMGANLETAYLDSANLGGANLGGAKLIRANLGGANLDSANLESTNLKSTKNLSTPQIKSACFWEKAIFTDFEWNEKEQKWVARDKQANQQKIEEIRQDKASDPTNPPDCSSWKPQN